MADYLYTAGAADVALTTTRRTILQVATPASIPLSLVSLDITFDGTTATAVPVLVLVERQASAGAGGVALTAGYGPNPLDPNNPASSVTALKGVWATTEPVMSTVYKGWRWPPTMGLPYQWPLDQEIVLPASSWLGITVTPGAAVNCSCWLTWKQ